MAMSVRLLGAIALVSLGIAGCGPTAARPTEKTEQQDGVRLVPLDIRTAKGTVHYKVEVAITPQEQSRGLMYRTSLPDHGGMIFPMTPPRPASFWMKNTYIPLDMIFIRPDGTIARIAANTIPENLEPVDSGEPVSAVLEIIGGGAAANGIAKGDKVSWKTPA
ncbi:hypothetical protein ASE00_11085 [Sphingomonas sp. Root710]|uniref:DUF192 domain-containing protein n=1 Tax=Sphingomonas sp. Root710 TaxID=1736594 RepID=UPI0006F716AB|nr:DUF192 domain-containing protein [Sphingomonas sp. Root710]KRB82580.1 hypothetical protein ASE00_11085 [Sphingomonas sp. Root710]